MLHSFTKIFVHLIWSTKSRARLLKSDIKPVIEQHIVQYATSKGIRIDCINVQIEHVHVLISLSSDQKVDEVVKFLKGESSHWINSENLIHPKFSWQRGYGAFSISSSHIVAVREYIKNQDEHHRKKSFAEELNAILLKYGFSAMETDESVWE